MLMPQDHIGEQHPGCPSILTEEKADGEAAEDDGVVHLEVDTCTYSA